MAKGASISGFPEWLPSERVVEQRVIDTLRNVFELNGFIGIETRAVEQGSSLLKKGETSKEIYLLSRLQEVGHESDTPIEDRLGLHFDLTVPLSRYVVEHSGDLAFPFKRWQIQKVWRGERPQEGRFREFVQADIDVIGNGDLPDHYEVELPLVMVSALERLREFGLPKATVHANNRKLSEGFYRGLGLTDIEGVLREIDKLDKIGADEVAKLLVEGCGADEAQARACLELAELTAADGKELSDKFDALCAKHDIASDSDAYVLARQGLDTLAMIVDEAARIRPGSVIADLKIARGLDYYTGSVYETFLDGAAALGSICSGGRYDNLAEYYTDRPLPGVGISIGLTRLFYVLNEQRMLNEERVMAPADVMIVPMTDDLEAAVRLATELRAQNIRVQLYAEQKKFKAKIQYADKLHIPYVVFLGEDEIAAGTVSLKDLRTGDQVTVPAQDAAARILADIELRGQGTILK